MRFASLRFSDSDKGTETDMEALLRVGARAADGSLAAKPVTDSCNTVAKHKMGGTLRRQVAKRSFPRWLFKQQNLVSNSIPVAYPRDLAELEVSDSEVHRHTKTSVSREGDNPRTVSPTESCCSFAEETQHRALELSMLTKPIDDCSNRGRGKRNRASGNQSDDVTRPEKKWRKGKQSLSRNSPATFMTDFGSLDDVQVGSRLGVYWPLDDVYYSATVQERYKDFFYIRYELDDFCEWLDLTEHKIKLLPNPQVEEQQGVSKSPQPDFNTARGGARRKWDREEDAKLIDAVMSRAGNNIEWDKVAMLVPGRTGLQCRKRWPMVDPKYDHQELTLDECRLLMRAQAEHGNRWSEIAKRMPQRTNVFCQDQWRNFIKPAAIRYLAKLQGIPPVQVQCSREGVLAYGDRFDEVVELVVSKLQARKMVHKDGN